MPPSQDLRDAIVRLRGMALDDGMTTADMAQQLRESASTIDDALTGLLSEGKVEQLVGTTDRWRLAPTLRSTADLYMRVAGLIREGEWTSYGDLSIAVRGDLKGKQAVGRAAATFPRFPNPHRVLRKGGEIPNEWRDWSGNGPEACKALLAAEGVNFTEDGRASPGSYVTGEELIARWDAGDDIRLPQQRPTPAERPTRRDGHK